jgi:hypothetical protein
MQYSDALIDFSIPPYTMEAVASFGYIMLCLLLLALCLQLPFAAKRLPRSFMGLIITCFTLKTFPHTITAETQPFGLILAFICCGVGWTMLYWTLVVPLDRTPALLEVLSSYIQHSAYGVRKGHAKYLRAVGKSQTPGGKHLDSTTCRPDSPAARAAPAGSEPLDSDGTVVGPVSYRGSWLFAILRCLTALLLVGLVYDAVFVVMCRVNPWCDPAIDPPAPFESVSKAAAAAADGGVWKQAGAAVLAYVELGARGFLPFYLLLMAIDIGYGWIDLALHVAAVASPGLRLFASQLPYHAMHSPWAAASLRDYWGFRWQQCSRFHFEHLGYPAVDKLLPNAAPLALRAGLHAAAAFCMSALTHEYMNWAVYGYFSGCYFVFFALHCLAAVVEGLWPSMSGLFLRKLGLATRPATGADTGSANGPGKQHTAAGPGSVRNVLVWVLKRCWVWAVLVVSSPWFFEPMRAGGFYSCSAYYPFWKPLTPRLLPWLTAQEYQPLGYARGGFTTS